MSRKKSEQPAQEGSRFPTLMGDYTDEELNQKVIDNAKYFTVIEINRGGFVRGGNNYTRHQVDSIEEARVKAKELYESNGSKRTLLIYAVADFAGASGFSRPIESYPPTTYVSKSDRAKQEKLDKKKARDAAREVRLNLGKKHGF
jgi:hypothetical protein